MKFIKLLFGEARRDRVPLLAASTLPGVMMSGVIALVTTVANYDQSKGPNIYLMAFFIIASVALLLAMNYALNATTAVISNFILQKRLDMARAVRSLDLEAFEKIGAVRVDYAIGRDLQTIEEAAPTVIVLIYFVTQLLSSALYIGYLSLIAFAVTLLFLGVATFFYRSSYAYAEALSKEATELESAFRSSFDHLLRGFREIKMNARRDTDLFDNYIVQRALAVQDLRASSGRGFNRGQTLSDAFFYGLLGCMVFLTPYYISDTSTPAKIILVIVFSGGAIASLIQALPAVSRADLAVDRLHALERELEEAKRAAEAGAGGHKAELVHGIALRGVSYRYKNAGGQQGFQVGPCDLFIKAGEVTFIAGGNGSGKSTLINLITQLYAQDAGEVRWDETVVGDDNAAAYRQLFSVIFSDFHLFDRLYGLDAAHDDLADLIREMDLSEKVHYKQGRFSTTDLSSGQRKRLAMVSALAEGRPVLIFDEWAADQDPQFRRYYYEKLLPRLKAAGKTIIAVSHDDRWFKCADTVIWMEEGQVRRVLATPET
ncbi:cyclic peptide transporter [Burkholderia sp. SFA1]|uniref:cyclic peptide export ABC transporter n=1 Tax=Caballeronia sp. CLC5 TaxID=2906764 RepID=UPI001F36A563|nr:cyclic peptide export ABC transporter [Caballeronia sp. CLC5]MCE4573791.1 cyclic peptide export ABC transporter [Caballeronia sp. CLC5]BBQ00636.1 cyclic peptide transporter [Burkholderia sp. SFA1]